MRTCSKCSNELANKEIICRNCGGVTVDSVSNETEVNEPNIKQQVVQELTTNNSTPTKNEIFCPDCGTKVFSLFCPNCGRKNQAQFPSQEINESQYNINHIEQENTSIQNNTLQNIKNINCPNCGSRMENNHCNHCGGQIKNISTEPTLNAISHPMNILPVSEIKHTQINTSPTIQQCDEQTIAEFNADNTCISITNRRVHLLQQNTPFSSNTDKIQYGFTYNYHKKSINLDTINFVEITRNTNTHTESRAGCVVLGIILMAVSILLALFILQPWFLSFLLPALIIIFATKKRIVNEQKYLILGSTVEKISIGVNSLNDYNIANLQNTILSAVDKLKHQQ